MGTNTRIFGGLAGAFSIALGLVAAVLPARAGDFPFEKGDVIRLIVPYKPGGGFDRIARLIQPAFAKALATLAGGDEVTVLVENKVGAGGQVAYEYIYKAPADGTRMVLLDDQGAALQQVAQGADFDLERFTYLAQVNQSDTGILVRADLGLKSMADLQTRAARQSILFGTAGAGSSNHIAALIMQAILKEHGIDLPMAFVHFAGSKETLGSMQRGEAEATVLSGTSALPAMTEGYADMAVLFAPERNPYLPDSSTALEQGVPGAEEIARSIGVARVLIAPPGVPDDRAQVLRKALEMALGDAEFLASAERAKLPVIYASAAQARETVMDHSRAILKYRETVRKALGQQ